MFMLGVITIVIIRVFIINLFIKAIKVIAIVNSCFNLYWNFN